MIYAGAKINLSDVVTIDAGKAAAEVKSDPAIQTVCGIGVNLHVVTEAERGRADSEITQLNLRVNKPSLRI